ncbi:TRAP transporter substrate-binding protein [uncultured Serinicoccus sp.]|uniref:TRAP transporter substrate-binding protein n=1 Tax=uncultured Serinicoccus sp. TaxID=735514 RepID=UPI002635F560|nr:TRAP transporter substrate-binding protein [uncultured Serinicoccus sp.]
MFPVSRKSLTAIAIAGALTLTACGGGEGAEGGEATEMRLGHVFGVDSTMHEAAESFADRVSEETDGRLDITVFPAGQLGGDEALGQDLSRGTLDFAFLNPGSLAGMDPLMDFHYLPYIVTDYDQADEIFWGDGVIPTTLSETLGEQGMTSLGTFELEFRAVTNNVRPIEGLDDLSGLKLRVPGSAAIRSFFDAAGAQTLVMPMPELISGLQQNTVDGQDNGVLITTDAGLADAQEYFTPTRHVYAVGSIVISSDVWDGLGEEDQQTVRDIAEDVAAEQVEENRARVEEYTAALADGDVQVTELSDAAQQEFREFGLDQWAALADTYGQDRIDQLRAELDALGS